MSSSQYNTCSALHRSSQGVQLWNPEQTPLTHRVGQLDTIDSEKETHDPCAQTLLLTGAPGCPTESATGSRQCNSLQCSLVHGSGRLFPTPLTEQDQTTRRDKDQQNTDWTRRRQRTNRGGGQGQRGDAEPPKAYPKKQKQVTVAGATEEVGPATPCQRP